MKQNYPYLNDMDFLVQVINSSNLQYYVNVTVLDWEEHAIKDFEGKVTNANINIDGNSAVRRTANVSFIVEEGDEDVAALLALNKKICLEIGYLNETDNVKYFNFPIIWFPLGIYIITGISFSNNLSNGISASLELKDKMCLLNGDCGGVLPAATVFDSCEVYSTDGTVLIKRPTIDQIIRQLVNHFGGEQLGKIIIADLEKRIRQAITWTGDVPLYVLSSGSNNNSYLYTVKEEDALSKIQSGNYANVQGSPFEAGSNVGFILTDFTYPGDLIGNPGDTVVTILDKIKNTLGNFEYFYDINGNFRFQEIKNYLNNSQSKYILESLQNGVFLPEYLSAGEAYLIKRDNGKAVFSFKDNKNLVISYSNTPKINSIKNDFIIWGIRKDASGRQYPLRYHLAIDNKPKAGKGHKVFKYHDLYDENTERWYKPMSYTSKSSFPSKGTQGMFYYDVQNNKIYQWKKQNNSSKYVQINANIQEIITTDWRTQLYLQGVSAQPYGTDSNYYYQELLAQWPKIYDIEHGHFKQDFLKSGTGLDFYLDFINPSTKQSQKICINNIGRRSIVVNKNEDVNCVFQPYIPDVILINKNLADMSTETDMRKLRQECSSKGWNFTQIQDSIYNFLIPTAGLNSAYEEVRQSLHQYINLSENITLQTLPIYFLQPNTCIQVEDKNTFIEGNYIINSLSFSLDASSSLSINASKMISKI